MQCVKELRTAEAFQELWNTSKPCDTASAVPQKRRRLQPNYQDDYLMEGTSAVTKVKELYAVSTTM